MSDASSSSRSGRGLAPAAGLIIALAAVGLLRLRLLGVPLERDEGVYAYIGWRLHHGEVPYRDIFTDKPPLGHLLYGVMVGVGGNRVSTVRVAGLLWLLAAMVVAYQVARSCFGPGLSALATGVWGLSASLPTVDGPTFNLEMILALPMWASVWAAIHAARRGSWLLWAVAGVLAGLAFMTKQQAAPHAAFLGLWCITTGWSRRQEWAPRRLVTGLAGLVGGFLLVVALVFAGAWLVGAWDEFIDGCWLYNLRTYTRRMPLADALAVARGRVRDLFLGHFALFTLMAFSVAGAASRPGPRRWCLGWLVCQMAAVSIGGHFYRHYFQLVLPPLCLIAVDGVAVLLQTDRAKQEHRFAAQLTGYSAAALLVLVPIVSYASYFFTDSPLGISRSLVGPNPFPESQRVADYLRTHTDPDDQVFVYGSEPQILFLGQRRSASRYIFVYPVTSAGQEDRQRQVIDELRRRRPAYIVWVRVPSSQLWSLQADPLLEHEMQRLVRGAYRLDGAVLIEPTESTFYLGPDRLRDLPDHALRRADVMLLVRRDRLTARRP